MDVSSIAATLNSVLDMPHLAQTTLSRNQLGMVAAVVLLSVLVMISARRRKGLDAPPPRAYAREQIVRLREENGIREDMEELLGRVQEVARDFNAQLDTRFHKLERVLQDSDAASAQLERLLRAADGRQTCDILVSDRDQDERAAAATLPAPVIHPRHAAIYRLADSGRSSLEIAQATGQPVGEIKLILALRRPPGLEIPPLSLCG